MQIKIDHIAKIEGHAGFIADIADGKVQKTKFEVLEGARLLEGILRSRSIYEVSQITSRICGVCPVVHTLTSLKALEKAMDVEISEQTILLRKLMMLGQIINSHALHLFFFSLSDFFSIEDDLKLIAKFSGRAKDALAIREFGNQLIEVIGGRSIHPLTPQIGGFTKLPDKDKLGVLFNEAKKTFIAGERLANLFIKLKYPNFIRSAPYISLHHAQEYAIYDGLIKLPSEKKIGIEKFLKTVSEEQIRGGAVKQSEYGGQKFMVGALSRLNHNFHQLNPRAKKMLKSSKIHLPNFNPFYNILAQAIEVVHCLEESQSILHKVLRMNLKLNNIDYRIKAGVGAAAIEAPRGTLYYYYKINNTGLVEECNIITPTAQNIARLEDDLKKYLAELTGQKATKKEIEDKIKMLVRAYDPCLTCATH